MNHRWLSQTGASRLILAFGGWGLGTAPFEVLSGRADVLAIDSYGNLDMTAEGPDGYTHVSLLAYSFGVASAAHWLARTGFRPDRMVAVNGTLFPSDPTYGIAPDVVEATAKGLTPDSFARFCRRAGHRGALPPIDIPTAQAELLAIADRGPAPDPGFDLVWIATRDRIVPTAAQRAAWAGYAGEVRNLPNGAHQPFAAGQTWQEWLT